MDGSHKIPQYAVWRTSYTPCGGHEVRRELCRTLQSGEPGKLHLGDWQSQDNYQHEVKRGSYFPFGGLEVRRELCRSVKLGEPGKLFVGDWQSQENYPELCSLESQLHSL